MFSIVKQKNGYTRNPTARMFRSCFASISSFSLIKASEKCNCELDQDDFLTVDILNDVDVTQNQTNVNHQESEPIEEYKNNDSSNIVFQNSSSSSSSSESEPENMQNSKTALKDCSITYFAGYLA